MSGGELKYTSSDGSVVLVRLLNENKQACRRVIVGEWHCFAIFIALPKGDESPDLGGSIASGPNVPYFIADVGNSGLVVAVLLLGAYYSCDAWVACIPDDATGRKVGIEGSERHIVRLAESPNAVRVPGAPPRSVGAGTSEVVRYFPVLV